MAAPRRLMQSEEISKRPKEVSSRALSRRYGINYLTVKKWRERDSVEDRRSGPLDPRPKSLSKVEETTCIYFRTTTQLSLDDCLYSLQDSISHLKRSNLHRLFQKYRISTLPKEENKTPKTKNFKEYPIGLLPCQHRRKSALYVRSNRPHIEICLR